MANVHVYILVEALNLSTANQDTLFALMQSILGQGSGNQPSESNHGRTRLDGNAINIEALFDEDNISISSVRQDLADTFGIVAGDIGVATNQGTYGLEGVFSYPDGVTDRIRYIAFGYDGGWSTRAESKTQFQAYLLANAVAWGETE